jgi:dihydrofolate reductase
MTISRPRNQGIGAWIMGRNMFSPSRGPWPDDAWRGWWGKNPPYHTPVFLLTHHDRPPIQMEGGTVFHFVTGGIREALQRVTAAAGGKDIQVGGGALTSRAWGTGAPPTRRRPPPPISY